MAAGRGTAPGRPVCVQSRERSGAPGAEPPYIRSPFADLVDELAEEEVASASSGGT